MSTIDSQEEGESFRWRVRLSDNAPEKRVVVFAAAVLAFGFGWFGFKSPPLGIIGFAIILASTAEYWLGTSFAVDEKGASARTGLSLVAIDWADVKRLIWDEKGVRLSPLAAAGTMDAFRGVYLRYGWDNREAIERVIISIGRIRGIVDGGADAGAGDLADRKDRDGSLPPETADGPAVMMLELHKPIMPVAAQASVVMAPFAIPFFGFENFNDYSRLMTKRENVDKLLNRIESMTLECDGQEQKHDEKNRKKARRGREGV